MPNIYSSPPTPTVGGGVTNVVTADDTSLAGNAPLLSAINAFRRRRDNPAPT